MIDGFAAHGGAFTVNVTTSVAVSPFSFVKTASSFVPLSAIVVGEIAKDVEFAPGIGDGEDAPGASENHCTVGGSQFAGLDADAENDAVAGAVTLWELGCSTIAGFAAHAGASTVKVTTSVVIDPNPFVNTASSSVPD